MRQIESFNLGEISFCISAFEVIRILPGINLLSSEQYQKLTDHPSFEVYLRRGIFEEVHINENEFVIDPDTNITVLETATELVPIQNVLVNSKSVPLAPNGVNFSPGVCRQAGLSQDIGHRIANYAPPSGWISADQIRQKLELDNTVDLSKLPFPEVNQTLAKNKQDKQELAQGHQRTIENSEQFVSDTGIAAGRGVISQAGLPIDAN